MPHHIVRGKDDLPRGAKDLPVGDRVDNHAFDKELAPQFPVSVGRESRAS